MPKRMLIDASHPEETRVVVFDGNKVEEFDFESASKRPLKGNIYLAKVTRVEPSLQAAFVEYGGNRQGFLAFSEIHPDYYQIPVADRMALLEAQTQRMLAEDEDIDSFDTSRGRGRRDATQPAEHDEHHDGDSESEAAEAEAADAAEVVAVDEAVASDEEYASGEDESEAERAEQEAQSAPQETTEALVIRTESEPPLPVPDAASAEPIITQDAHDHDAHEAHHDVQAESTGAPQPYQRRDHRNDRPRPRRRQYKIQEVIKRRQVMLVQVVKEERGNKGASLTTFLSLAGRYCVLMPNTPRGGGISRKITSATDRKRLKSAAQSLDVPEGMGLIIRTAGANRTKVEIKRDYEYLLRLWDNVRELTLRSNAPALTYEEGSLIKRAIRDLYNKDISEIIVDGEAGYRDAKEFMRMLMPSHAKNVKPYKEALPLFQSFHVEAQLDAMFSPVVTLRSGGYIVINQTEALVSIDVNSGKATREHSIEETATKTNLEAADEIARQLRLRDLAGLIVIDFIDMEDSKNDRNVEKRLHNAVKNDRARIQIGKISQFGLLEMSRQRLRAGVLAGSTVTCPHCAGMGLIRSTESAALRLLRALDEEGQRAPAANIRVKAPEDVTIYTLNQKRREIARIEEAYDLGISFDPQASMVGGTFEIERTGARVPAVRPKAVPVSVEAGFDTGEEEAAETDVTIVEAPASDGTPAHDRMERAEPSETRNGQEGGSAEHEGRRRRRRRRRGGRGRNGHPHPEMHGGGGQPQAADAANAVSAWDAEPSDAAGEDDEIESTDGGESIAEERTTQQPHGHEPHAHGQPNAQGQPGEGGRRRRRRRGRRGRGRRDEQGHMPAQGGIVSTPSGMNAAEHGAPEHGHAHEQAHGQPQEHAREPFTPNAPSSPQWNLSNEPVAPAHTEARAAVHEEPVGDAIERAQPSVAPEISFERPAEAASEAPPEDESGQPRESRKGWWQRRFKM